jgi:hypothetical protein
MLLGQAIYVLGPLHVAIIGAGHRRNAGMPECRNDSGVGDLFLDHRHPCFISRPSKRGRSTRSTGCPRAEAKGLAANGLSILARQNLP